jgi:hypothetical protein
MATGIVIAAVTVLGIMAAPIMIKSGYSRSFLPELSLLEEHWDPYST